ncbi:hypothetical protein BN159_5547 [Streptomyces davaonensis JCM 4913]|uniref:Uncharacterized protein n=1 Tax=Streptomyces davaonensis (strain DSM 101723 / JCM 4913 / KCC S-0913 / 768) TaxID=1214101 RepID=K4R0X8_STRDJ|nr:hypothetical protein [Streptomyces davaonensis]CCK29926.1 hypothetical protein BN159_5547 [Streptomyces davaonensis JCM 4913]
MSYEPGLLRPEVPLALAPLRRFPDLLRRRATGLAGPEFARARRVTAGWALLPPTLTLAGLLLPDVRTEALGCAVLLGLLVLLRAVLLVIFERLQQRYEPRWLAERTAALRDHEFPVLRCSVRTDETPGLSRVYDLTCGDQVGRLLDRRARERASGTHSRATLEFVCATPGRGQWPALGEVRRELAELELLTVRPVGAQARIRFPQARYLALPEPGRRPARRAYWELAGPVLVAAAGAGDREGAPGSVSAR